MAVEDRAAARLTEIAALLGCPVEKFFAPDHIAVEADMTRELLSLWSAIRQPQIRQRILDAVRRETRRDAVAAEAAE